MSDLPRPPIKIQPFPPPHLLLWPGHQKGSPIWRLRRAYRICWQRRLTRGQKLKIVLRAMVWPLIAIGLAVHATRRYGKRYTQQTGVGRLSQFLSQVHLAACYRILPKYYYIFALERPEMRRRAAEYVTRTETKSGVYRALKQRENRDQVVRISDKLVFSTFFAKNGIRAVPLVAAYRAGVRVPGVGPAETPRDVDLFVKPIEGRGGGGTEAWLVQSPGRYRSSRGEEKTLEELLEHVAARSKGGGEYLVQPRLVNHPDIADLTPGALTTVRLLTVLDEKMEPEAVNAAFRMAISRASPVDNFHAGGIAAAVDMATGTLGRASGLGLGGDFSWHEKHPLTGGVILGRRLPDWEAAKALAVAAHRLLAPRIVVGWDIGFLADGPCLVEGNVGPDADIHQRAELQPIGNGRYGELLAVHLERRLKL
ncbi:MAG TPA: sugar-transfer associated ATP-grasp domain-containing protein [Dongiaceae bacterium]|nr:sugar-transfer associated ATP-grasp domain-containing protein [Dongiaceae bacterium]